MTDGDGNATESGSVAATSGAGGWGPLRRLYEWVLSWAHRPGGPWALGAIAVAEASFFPIPPDVLLIPLCLGRPRRSWWFAAICTVGSVVGAVLGYLIGAALYQAVALPILELYGYTAEYEAVGRLYAENLVLTLGTAGFTPIPFKVFTIAAGGFAVPFVPFLVISMVSRGARFFIVAGLIRRFGEPIRQFIDRHFNWLSIALAAAVVGGFLALGLL